MISNIYKIQKIISYNKMEIDKLEIEEQLNSQETPKTFYKTKKFLIISAIAALIVLITVITLFLKTTSKASTFEPVIFSAKTVSTSAELYQAIFTASPGDVISVSPGTYDYSIYDGAQKFYTEKSGTKTAPITLTALDPNNPPLLVGKNSNDGYVLHITGDYWIIDNLKLSTSQKGIVLDNSNYSIIKNCEIFNTGAEAVALRDGSSYNLVQNCYIHDTGLVSPGYGEGVYIGSAVSTTQYNYYCDYNVVQNYNHNNNYIV